MTSHTTHGAPIARHLPRRPTGGEKDQMDMAFWAALDRAAPLPLTAASKPRRRTVEIARAIFTLGWIAGARNGSTGAALENVPLPTQVVGDAFAALDNALPDEQESTPRLLQQVSYHGSIESKHGRYWVTEIQQEAPSTGGETSAHYTLSVWTGHRFQIVVSNVNPKSVTGLPVFFQRVYGTRTPR
ncbi:hypothetical protein SLUN_00010 [Streptomyces lunaelactis]|uniref:Uncharacterized protein n=1 Tax=Streptomyces lunaelactis TaxID=1535768 RepID=A0A2R4SVJ9_9ACTN|nr:hypothetical protein [Streptomyces lunaelactis]AVZ70888.1 hypothetical protein SLUN_00010 [Streptomyces lunaelactis]NUK28300.1 hypothetical protein [Streptomyces lunaelactis]NUK89972.1 hypothetical protein [Streptomyces lunaelactis]